VAAVMLTLLTHTALIELTITNPWWWAVFAALMVLGVTWILWRYRGQGPL
jgi:hypothetical protein